MICPYCDCESTPIGCGDEVLDFCGECSRIIEGVVNECAVIGCNKPVREKEWCHKHYTRWWRHGDPNLNLYKDPNRFWEKIDKSGDCWEWTAGRDTNGYGNAKLNGVRLAHRISYTLEVGDIPKGMHVLHKCDNPPCVNPEHLYLGTQVENNLDRDNRGRGARGERASTAKLTNEAIPIIRKMLADGEATKVVAKRFGVLPHTIRNVKNGKSWTHISE